MPDNNVVEFPGAPVRLDGRDCPLHPTLAEALRESARHRFERELKALWAHYALPGWNDSPMDQADFLDCALLIARELHYLHALTWKDAFRHVILIVTSRPECNRSAAIVSVSAHVVEHGDDILRRLVRLPIHRHSPGA